MVVVVLIAANLNFLLRGAREWPRILTVRERAYFQAADWLRAHAFPGQSVLVGEVGVLGWALPELRVLDSSGINSRAVLRLRREDARRVRRLGLRLREPDVGTADWVRAALREFRPDYLVSIEVILHLPELGQDPNFRRAYRLVQTVRLYPSPPVLIYQRIAPAPQL